MRFILLLFTVLFCGILQAQVYQFPSTFSAAGGTVTNCSGTFLDNNPFGNYGNNQAYFGTFTPSTANRKIRLTFATLRIGTGDTLSIFDGPDTTAPTIARITDFVAAGGYTVLAGNNNPTGSISFRFSSDASVVDSGWNATVACAFPCQAINGQITSPGSFGTGTFIYACLNDTIPFTANLTFSQNNTNYSQTPANVRYAWRFGGLGADTTGIGIPTVRRRITAAQGYRINVDITDSNGCRNTQTIFVNAGAAGNPRFNLLGDTLCLGDTSFLTSTSTVNGQVVNNVTPSTQGFTQPPISGNALFIPDGPTTQQPCVTPYSDTINVNSFQPGQTFTSVTDLEKVFMNIEHSYVGDLQMSLIAPNGAEVVLKRYVVSQGNSGKALGFPVIATNNEIGTGAEYSFSHTQTQYGTMPQEYLNAPNTTWTSPSGQTQSRQQMRPGNYRSEDPFTAFIGSPLNGRWIIKICDNWAVDNGYLFSWGLTFNPNLFPSTETFTTGILEAKWITSTGMVQNNGATALVAPATPGNFSYTFRVTDSAGCNFDTAVNVLVNPLPIKPDLGADTIICADQQITLNVLNPESGITYNWSNGLAGTSTNINTPGQYRVIARNAGGCTTADTIQVNLQTNISISLGNDTLYCATNPNVLQTRFVGNITQFWWSDGSTNSTLPITDAGTYWVRGTTPSGCNVFDTILVTQNPVNTYTMPADTAICDELDFPLTVTLPHPDASITWYDGTTGPTHIVNQQRQYQSTANYIGCTKTDSTGITIKPLPVVYIGNDTAICNGFTVPLRVAYPGASYRWKNGSTDSSITVTLPDFYWVDVTFNSCVYRDSLQVTLKNCDCNTTVPNAFSPNGDGINDVFKPTFTCFPQNYRFSVFNRYGQLIFETRDFNTGWNGTYNGSAAPVGTYYYIIKYYNSGLQKDEQFTGSVTILR